MGSAEDIQRLFRKLENDRRNIIEGLIQLTYFMRGAIQYDDMKNMTYVERQLVSDFINQRLEQEAKKMNPTY